MNIAMPVIKIEIESMRHTLLTMLSEYSVQMDKQIREAVDLFCDPNNIKYIVEQEVNRCIEVTIKQEIQNFFTYGSEGKKFIAEAVKKKLMEDLDLCS